MRAKLWVFPKLPDLYWEVKAKIAKMSQNTTRDLNRELEHKIYE